METKAVVPIGISIVAIIIAIVAIGMKAAPGPEGPPGPQGPIGPAGAMANPEQIKVNTSWGILTLAQIAQIQPGLGTVMIEYGNRFYIAYYAAKAGNWDLAKYQLKEAREIQEVGETTRPNRAAPLKAFESSYLDPLDKTIDAKDWNAFETAYNKTVEGCNGCHAGTGYPYIKYTLPSSPPNIP